jgi:hypothetical protein
MKPHFTLGELIQRSAERIVAAEKILLRAGVIQHFLPRESSHLLRLSARFWFVVRWEKFKSKFPRK